MLSENSRAINFKLMGTIFSFKAVTCTIFGSSPGAVLASLLFPHSPPFLHHSPEGGIIERTKRRQAAKQRKECVFYKLEKPWEKVGTSSKIVPCVDYPVPLIKGRGLQQMEHRDHKMEVLKGYTFLKKFF